MNGYASFNQVFMTDAEIEPELQMGKNGEGWKIATTTLMHERRGADGLRSWAIASDKPGRAYDEEREEIRTTMEPYKCGDPGVGAGQLDRRRYRRDPAQHHQRTRAEDAARADRRHGKAVQGCSAKYCGLGRQPAPAGSRGRTSRARATPPL